MIKFKIWTKPFWRFQVGMDHLKSKVTLLVFSPPLIELVFFISPLRSVIHSISFKQTRNNRFKELAFRLKL